MNPFLLKGYKSPKYFCDRKVETDNILRAIKNQQDITLFAVRRIGKSALLHHIFFSLKKEYDCIYIDIWGTTSLNGFINETANSVIQSAIFSKRSIGKKLTDFIKSMGASLTVGVDGNPSLDIMFRDKQQVFNRLEEIFMLLENNKNPVILAFDEFQEIKKYSDGVPLEAKMRSLVQKYQNIRFIFSGSEQHLLADIFSDISKPFYQSTRMIELKKIANEDYHGFITNHFLEGNRKINDQIIGYVLSICHGHTYYIQAICNFLYSQTKMPESIAEFERKYLEFIAEKGVFYSELPRRLTKHQFTTVKAIARKGRVKSPTSADFLLDSEVNGASSMQRIIKALIEKQVIIRDQDSYRLYDVFLEHFLKYLT